MQQAAQAEPLLQFYAVIQQCRLEEMEKRQKESMGAMAPAAPGGARTVDGGAPLAGSATTTLYIAGRPEPPVGQAPIVTRHYIGPDHFDTLGIPLLDGRAFRETDNADSPRVVIVSQAAARRIAAALPDWPPFLASYTPEPFRAFGGPKPN